MSSELYDAYLTPARPEAARRERELGEAATVETIEGVVVRRWGEGPPVVLMHGWGSHGLAWSALVPKLVEAGLQAIAPDAPGHGESVSADGRSNMFRFAATLRVLGERFGPLRGVVGHSVGASAIPKALAEGLAAERAVLISPTARVNDFLGRWARANGLSGEEEADVGRRWEAEFGAEALAKADPLVLAPDLGRVQALIVHDAGDPEAPVEDGEALAKVWPGARLLRTERLGHARILLDRGVAGEIAEFLS